MKWPSVPSLMMGAVAGLGIFAVARIAKAKVTLQNGQTVLVPIEAVSVDVPQQAVFGQPTDVDALRAIQANSPGSILTIRNILLTGDLGNGFHGTEAVGQSDAFPSRLRFKRTDVKKIL